MAKRKGGIWTALDSFEGDKVVAMIMMLLVMISFLAISSSTPLLALQNRSTRNSVIMGQFGTASIGLLFTWIFYKISSEKVLNFLAWLGLWGSLFLLLMLDLRIRGPIVRAEKVNDAYRSLRFFGVFPIQVFEVVKLGMILYIAKAVVAWRRRESWFYRKFAGSSKLGFLADPFWDKVLTIYLPIGIVSLLVARGSNSSAVIIGGILFLIALVGGIEFGKKDFILCVAAISLGGMVLVLGSSGSGEGEGGHGRTGTLVSRINSFFESDTEKQLVATLDEYGQNSKEFTELLDKNRQQISAKIAVSEGGFIGKGPGNSTQRYVVPVMFEDYMYSFVIEEYGLFGGLFVLALYISLLARGAIIVRNSEDDFMKLIVSGLVMLIVFQAMIHILVNVDLMPMTGQTLPLVSYGKSSFLIFCTAFGIIMAISRQARKKIEMESKEAAPLVERKDDRSEELDQIDKL